MVYPTSFGWKESKNLFPMTIKYWFGTPAAAGLYQANFQPKWQPENVISPEPSPHLVPF
jgi:hypothetical protein